MPTAEANGQTLYYPHGANLERAEEFNRLVLDFVAEHSRAAVS